MGLLAFEQLGLARDGQLRQRGAAVHCGRVHALQDLGEGRAVLLGVRHLAGQGAHLFALALLGRSGLQRIKEFGLGHG